MDMRSPTTLTFALKVRRDSAQPLAEQIAGQVGAALESGMLRGGSRLPSTRTLAAALGVSRGVTTAAYDLLHARGQLTTRTGSGTFAARHPGHAGHTGARRPPPPDPRRSPPTARRSQPPAARPSQPSDATRSQPSGARRSQPFDDRGFPLPGGRHAGGSVHPPVDLRPGQASAELVPLRAWRAAWREATLRRPPPGPLPELGLPRLREAVAAHLGGPREDQTVVITGGATPGLDLVLTALGPHRRPVPTGDFRGLLGPCLPVGYALAHPGLAGRLGRALADRGEQPSYVAQIAVATLLRDGTVDRLNREVGRRRATRAGLAAAALGDLRGARYADGTLHLAPHADAVRVAAVLLARGVRVTALASPPALLFGLLGPADADLRRALAVLRATLR